MASHHDPEKGTVVEPSAGVSGETAEHFHHEIADRPTQHSKGRTSKDEARQRDETQDPSPYDAFVEQQEEHEAELFERAESTLTRRTTGSRVSRLASSVASMGRRERLPAAPLPLTDLDKGIVGWDSQDDPKMPLNFTSLRKWLIIVFLAMITLMTPYSSSMLAPAITYMNEEFDNPDLTKGSFPVSIYLL